MACDRDAFDNIELFICRRDYILKNLRSLLAFLFLVVVMVLSLGVMRQSYTANSNDSSEKPAVITTRASVSSEQSS